MAFDVVAGSFFCQTACFRLFTHPIFCFCLDEVKFFHRKQWHIRIYASCISPEEKIRIVRSKEFRARHADVVFQPTQFHLACTGVCRRNRTRARHEQQSCTRIVGITATSYVSTRIRRVVLVERAHDVGEQEFRRNCAIQQVGTRLPRVDNRLRVAPRAVLLLLTAVEVVTRFAAEESTVHCIGLPNVDCLLRGIENCLASCSRSIDVWNVAKQNTCFHSINQSFPFVQIAGINAILSHCNRLIARSVDDFRI